MPDLQESPKKANACGQCRTRKVKCMVLEAIVVFQLSISVRLTQAAGDGAIPCSRCQVLYPALCITLPNTLIQVSKVECFYPISRRGRKKLDKSRKATLEDRMAQMEAMVQVQYNKPFDATQLCSVTSYSPLLAHPRPQEADMTSTWNGTKDARSMSMDISDLGNSPAMSFGSGKLTSSIRASPLPTSRML